MEIDDRLLEEFAAREGLTPEQVADLGQFLSHEHQLKHRPVGVREFVTSKHYLAVPESTVWPRVMDELEEINSGRYDEFVGTGGIGTAKTYVAVLTTLYQLYLLSCYRNPHELYGLDPADEIVFIFQNITERLAKSVDYQRFKARVETAPYFRRYFPFDKNIESEMRFPNRIIVRPVAGNDTGAIGQNVYGGSIDELNYMALVKDSAKSVDRETYDQAVALYNSIARRRESRFMKAGGFLPGVLCLTSAKRYPGQFTDRKTEEAKTNPRIYVYDKRTWDVKPEGSYGPGRFRVFIGDRARNPRLLADGEQVSEEDRHLVDEAPLEYLKTTQKDLISALREVFGRSTLSRHPFVLNVGAVAASFGKRQSVFKREWADFHSQSAVILKSRITDKDMPRFAHVDLGLTGDSAGLAIGHVPRFVEVEVEEGHRETMPVIAIDGILEVRPPPGGEILFSKIRAVLYRLRALGMPIKWVSFDSYQSVDSIQILRSRGFAAGTKSMDKDRLPYDTAKRACYDGRLLCPAHVKAHSELLALEDDPQTGKIDHPPQMVLIDGSATQGSKDCADALAGVVYGLTMRREVWHLHGVPIFEVPEWVREASDS